jgi:hypothetical protein
MLRLQQQSSSIGDGAPVNGNRATLAAAADATVGNGGDLSITPPGGNGRPPHHPRRRGADPDADVIDDQPPHSTHKVEFPKFDGTGPMA